MISVKELLTAGIKFAQKLGKERGPELLMAAGTVAMGMTVRHAIKAAPTAEFNREFFPDFVEQDQLDQVQAIERYCHDVIRPYLPAIGWGVVTLGCFWGSHILEKRKTAAAVLALGALDRSFAAYRDEHPMEIKHDSDYVTIEETPAPPETEIPGKGDTLYYDKVGMHWFYSTEGRIKEGESKVNQELLGSLSVPLNFLYSCWETDDDGYVGEAIGFNDRCPCDIIMRPTMTKDHRPAIALIYSTTVIDENALRR